MPQLQKHSVFGLARLHGATSQTLWQLLRQSISDQKTPPNLAIERFIKPHASQTRWRHWMREAEALEHRAIEWVWIGAPGYPDCLLRMRLEYYWPMLFVSGSLSLFNQPAIGIVGTRLPKPAAVKAVHNLAGELARRGINIVSGNARGIDSAAHQGALDAGGPTTFVLPTDLTQGKQSHQSRPAAHNPQALWVSACLPGETIHRGHFIRRNELLAGLCDALIVGEAGAQSGAFYAVKTARRNNIPVFVLCNRRGQPHGQGGEGLLRQGAQPLVPGEAGLSELIHQAQKARQAHDQLPPFAFDPIHDDQNSMF